MEKSKPHQEHEHTQQEPYNSKIWDCGSSLYDSFELTSLQHRLDSAISTARTFSLPHFATADNCCLPKKKKKKKKLFRSFQRLLQSVFRSKSRSSHRDYDDDDRRVFVVYDKSGALSPPEIGSFVAQTTSERFTVPSSIGISYAKV